MLTPLFALLIAAAPIGPFQSPAIDRAARFEREDREYDREGVHGIHVPSVWTKLEGEGWAHVRRHATEPQQRFGPELVERSMGFSQAVAVLPAGTQHDGTRMPPTCVFGLPDDGRGSIWFESAGDHEPQRVRLTEEHGGLQRFGKTLLPAGDLDGDGVPDLVIGTQSELGQVPCSGVDVVSV